MAKFFFSILIFSLLISVKVEAQTQGCLVSGTLYNTSSQPISNTQCGWVKVTPSTWTSTQQSQCAGYGGVSGGFNQVPCPIDDYVWVLGVGVVIIAARRLQLFAN